MNEYPLHPILVVDNDKEFLKSMELTLLGLGYTNILLCPDSRNVTELLQKDEISLIMLDIQMPYIAGDMLLKQVTEEYPHIPVLMITAYGNIRNAVKCMKLGAYEYIVKPVEEEELELLLSRSLESRSYLNEITSLRNHILSPQLEHPEAFSNIITNSQKMLSIFRYTEAIAASSQPVIITGESGVGKELIAKALHSISGRKGKFVTVNSAGLDDTLFSDTLFGHKKGAFTEAWTSRSGFVEIASRGTLFLDEIGDMSLQSQVKLLRLIQENEYYPLGSDSPVKAEIRIISATNKDLDTLMHEKKFRNDLYYRLRIHRISIPPLRERLDDIPLLSDFFIEEASRIYKKKKPVISPDAINLLTRYQYPGNIRELRSILLEAVCMTKTNIITPDTITALMDTGMINGESLNKKQHLPQVSFHGALPSLKQMNKILIQEAMRRCGNNQTKAARLLDISHQAVNRRLKKSKLL
jgi:DNA-binding NtrC family response regulator